jgi:signal transduction histidine kinase
MRERVAMYGGELTIRSTVDGYRVHATFPAPPARRPLNTRRLIEQYVQTGPSW